MDCILFRHGIAVEREKWEGKEAERPLTEKGRSKTYQAALGLQRLKIEPTHLLSSPLTRAHETAKILHAAFRKLAEVRLCDELLPDAPADKLLPLLSSLPPDACVICVGHEPHLGEAAGILLFGKASPGLSLKKAGACLIQFEEAPKSGRGLMDWWLTPSQLRALRKT